MKKILLVITLICCSFSLAIGDGIKHLRKFTLTYNDETFIQLPGSFFVSNDDLFYVLDYKAANLKIYDNSGRLVKIFGRKGVGPDEFLTPFLSAYREPFIAIGDFGRKTIFIYKRSANLGLTPIKNYLCLNMADDIQFFNDDKLLVSGYKLSEGEKAYHFYEYDFQNNEYEFLIPSERTYGFDSFQVYRNEYVNKIAYIGPKIYFDFLGDSVYFFWEGDLKITRFDRKKNTYNSFGKKTGNFIQPHVTPEIRKAYDERNHKLLWKFDRDVSFVKDIFILDSKKVGVLYYGPIKEDKGGILMLQLYKETGEFIKEYALLAAKASLQVELFSYFRKDKGLLYVLDTETSENSEQSHKMYEFKLEE